MQAEGRESAIDMRRRWLAAGMCVALIVAGLPPVLAEPVTTRAVPTALLEFDAAAVRLYDATRARHWSDARNALGEARILAASIDGLESSYTTAGGTQGRFFATTNQLSADLIDASAALSVYDRPWLLSSTENLLARSGDLTEPYASRIKGAVPRLEVLLVLARRMRQAPTWNDETGFATAHREFDRLWPQLRDQLTAQRPQLVMRVDAARAGVAVAPSSDNAGTLYAAVRDLLGTVGTG